MSTATAPVPGAASGGGRGAAAAEADDRLDQLAARVDRLACQVDRIAELLQEQRGERERRQALVHELTGVAQGVMAVASRELEDLSDDVEAEDVLRFLRTLARTLPRLEVMLTWAASIEELAAELTALSGSGMASLSQALAQAQARGYVDAVVAGGRVADRMATALRAERPAPPPSLLALLRRLRDPQLRAGLDRGLTLMQALGEPPGRPSRTSR